MSAKRSPAVDTTKSCWLSRHTECLGYVAPLVYSDTRPCSCPCHDYGQTRDFQAAMRRAKASYYGDRP